MALLAHLIRRVGPEQIPVLEPVTSTSVWQAAFMAGTLASPVGKGIQKASKQGGIHVHQSLPLDLKDHPLGNLFL